MNNTHKSGTGRKPLKPDYDSDFIWQTEPWPMREYILSEKDKNAIKLSELRKF